MNETSTPQAPDAPVTTRARPLIFLGTYIGGAVVFTVLLTFASGGSFLEDDGGMFFIVLFFTIAYLPWGLLRGIAWIAGTVFGASTDLFGPSGNDLWPEHPAIQFLLILSYASFVGLMIAGSLTKHQKTFRLVYMAFVILLILNIGGCLVDPP